MAILGMGHIGWEIAHTLSRLPVNLVLTDSRPNAVAPERMTPLEQGRTAAAIHHGTAPEVVLGAFPPGAAALVLTHDHAEDLILADAALRAQGLRAQGLGTQGLRERGLGAGPSYIGLIGSRSKWQRFRKKLREEGPSDGEIGRISCPIGLPEITGKDPATIAIAADLAMRWETSAANAGSQVSATAAAP